MKLGYGADKTVIQNFSFCSGGNGTNVSLIDVKDGRILRTRPFVSSEKYTPEEIKFWSIKKGDKEYKAADKQVIPPFSYVYKQRYLSPNRLRYPLKREDWSPENRNPQTRGSSKFVRISWDETLDIIANEVQRQYDVYGPGSIYVMIDGHGQTRSVHGPHGCMYKLLNLLGGCCLQSRNADSWEGWYYGTRHVWGGTAALGLQCNLLNDITQNCELLLVWSGDADTTPLGWGGMCASRFLFWCTDIGIKQVYICPDVNYSNACHADKWIPVYPNTDLALQWAIVYTWIMEGTYDREYIDTHVVGFEYIMKHALGEDFDGIAKTPEWAEPLCGVPARTIKALAREMHKHPTTIAHGNGGSFIRAAFSHEPARMEAVLLGMQGLGKPGRNQFRMVEWGHMGKADAMDFPRPEIVPNVGGAYNGTRNFQPTNFIVKTQFPQMIATEEQQWWFGTAMFQFPIEDQFVEYAFPPEDDSPYIHMIWSDSPCHTACWNHGNADVGAFRHERVEFVLMQHPWMENDMTMADILLPVNTIYETDDIQIDLFSGDMVKIFVEDKAVESLPEVYSDWEIVCKIADRMGMLDRYTDSTDVEYFRKRGWERSGVGDRMTYEEFKEKEYYIIPTADGWDEMGAGYYDFYSDPTANPIATPSGKLEFYSENLAEYFPDDDERRPYPQYIDESEVHHENRHCDRAEEFPFLLVSNHPHWRVHAQIDDTPWTREIETCKVKGPDGYLYEPLWINPSDARRYGLKTGDVAKIFNERGWVLGGVYVTERIMPEVLYQDHGARVDWIEPGVSDRGGSNNLISPAGTTSKNCVGMVTSGFLVGLEKVDVFGLAKQYPEAFSRPYDAEYGPILSSWVKEA
jgi:trimethylamine-N-oxide reductase (cytochrome c)